MYIAHDGNGNRVYIAEADKKTQYYCPICGHELIIRKGEVNAPHFAHRVGTKDECDDWASDMSEWHRNWQDCFPKECQEIVISYNGEKHRADVLVGKTVIEFQHSHLSGKEFWRRNNFYTDAGYELVWLFDMINEYQSGKIERTIKDFNYRWIYPWRTFGQYNCQKKGVSVYLQFSNLTSDDDYGIEHLVEKSFDSKRIITEYGVACNKDEFLAFFKEDEMTTDTIEQNYKGEDIYDTIIETKEYYYPCFMSSSASIPFENCDTCKYSIRSRNNYGSFLRNIHAPYVSGCFYRFKEIIERWNPNTDRVIDVKYDEEYRVTELTVSLGGQILHKEYESIEKTGKSIPEILTESKANVVGVINLHTGTRAKIGNSERYKNSDVRKVEGYLGKPQGGYYSDRREVYYWSRQEWIIEWEKGNT